LCCSHLSCRIFNISSYKSISSEESKHTVAKSSSKQLRWTYCWEYALEVIIEMMILQLYPWHILWVQWISIIDKLVLINNYVNCLWNSFTCMVILMLSLIRVRVRIHMNVRLAHVLVDDFVSQVIDIEMSN